jgi:hypothetical protein
LLKYLQRIWVVGLLLGTCRQLAAVLASSSIAAARLVGTLLLQRSPPWRDLLHDLSRRGRLLHVAHPFSTVLTASKVRAACCLLSDPSYRVTAKFEWYSSWLSTFAWSDVEYQHATRCCC